MACICSCAVASLVAVLGAILIIIGGCLIPVFNKQVSNSVKAVLPEGNESEPFKAWLNWTHFRPVYRHFYFFNVLNPNESILTGKNTTVKQTGPYVYRVNLERRNVSFGCNNTCLSYELYKTYTFERNMSVGDEADEITTVNLPILNLATRLRFTNKAVKQKVGKIIKRLNETLYSRVNVSDLLWGYENKNLKVVVEFLVAYYDLHPLNDTKYGLMYQSAQPKRSTFQGSFEASTGSDDVSNLWKIKAWNGNSSLSVWEGWCNKINGTDGYAWPPGQRKIAYIFDSEWCRSISLSPDRDGQQFVRWLRTIRYTYSKDAFDYKKSGKGFCKRTPKGKNMTCLDRGVLNVTDCKDNIPLLLSQPHFLGALYSYRRQVRGLSPDPTQHATSFNIEPMTGEVVEASRKMQLNAYVMHLSSFPTTKAFEKKQTVVPIVWMNEVYSMTDKERDSVYRVTVKRKIFDGIQYGLITLGALLLMSALVAIIVQSKSRYGADGERRPLLGNR